MNTAFFPFTCISPRLFNLLEGLFGTITVYLSQSGIIPEMMKPFQQENRLQIRVPSSGNEAELNKYLSDYRKWAENHTLSQQTFLKFRAESFPKSGETHSFKIRDEVMDRMEGKESVPGPDQLLAARRFLSLAHDYDIRQMEIENDLAQFRKEEDRLFNALKGEFLPGNQSEDTLRIPTDTPESLMIAERLQAWSRLMLQDDNLPEIYVTTSKEAFQSIIDETPGKETLSGFDAVSFPFPQTDSKPAASDHLMSYLKTLASTAWPPDDAENYQFFTDQDKPWATLTLVVFPDTSPREVFTRLLSQAALPPANRTPYRNMLMALVEV